MLWDRYIFINKYILIIWNLIGNCFINLVFLRIYQSVKIANPKKLGPFGSIWVHLGPLGSVWDQLKVFVFYSKISHKLNNYCLKIKWIISRKFIKIQIQNIWTKKFEKEVNNEFTIRKYNEFCLELIDFTSCAGQC